MTAPLTRSLALRVGMFASVGLLVAAVWLALPTRTSKPPAAFEASRRLWAAKTNRGMQIEVWLDSDPPFPYQAARLRSRISNAGKLTLARCGPDEGLFHSCRIGGPDAHRLLSPSRAVMVHDYHAYSLSASPMEIKDRLVSCLLPGEYTSASEAIAAESTRNEKNAWQPIIVPFFSAIGEYSVHAYIAVDHKTRQSQHVSITIRVVEPEGDEWRAYKTLEGDYELRVAMVSPVNAPADETRERLQGFIRDFGATSYGDYARFALARYYMGGSGERLRLNSDKVRQLADGVLWANGLADRANPVEDYLRRWCKGRPRSDVAVESAVAEIVATVDQSRSRLEAAVGNLVKLTEPEIDLPAAIALLDAIRVSDNKGFAYRPNALVALKVALEASEPKRANEIKQVLLSDCPDALVVLEELSHDVSNDDWRAFRVRRRTELPPTARGELAAVAEPPLAVEVARLSNEPYPYQAIRLRWSVANRGAVSLAPRAWAERWFDNLRVRPPVAAKFDPAYRLTAFRDSAGGAAGTVSLTDLNQRQPLGLGPGQRVAASAAMSAWWSSKAGQLQIDKPLFVQRGPYTMSIRYPLDPATQAQMTVEATINVGEPAGDERRACDALAADESLRNALLSPVDAPPLDVLPRLEEFLSDFSETSYGNYARFALARHHLRGCGESLRRDRLATLDFVKELSHIPLADRNADDLRRRVTQWASRRAALNDEINAFIDEAVTGFMNRHPEYPFLKLASATGVTKPQREAAIELLDQVGLNESFAYMPNVLVAIKEAYAMDGPTGEWQQILRQYYPDAIEVIECLAADIPADKWSTFRVRPVESDSTKEP